MKHSFFVSLFICCFCSYTQAEKKHTDYPIQQVNLNHVTLTDSFWLPKIQTIQKTTIRYAFDKCDSEGRFENFITAGRVMKGGKGKTRGVMPFDDTDVYKTIEGAAYSLISAPDPGLENYLDSIIAIVQTGQEPDGYLTTWRTIDPANPPAKWVKSGGGRWFDLSMSHELYNSGHLFEAATAHYWATGKRNFLDIAIKNADLLVKVFGDTANFEIPGHQIAETGLIKLYQITDNENYLKLAKKFLDLRGDATHRQIRGAYSQDHLPVTQQEEVVGHAVRAVYMYAGMTDIAAIYGDKTYLNAVNRLWENMVDKKLYITGGIGARHEGESFGENYELPNLTAYSETCAAIGSVYWNERLFRLTGLSKYYDVLERTMYNALIAGISSDGTRFFYPNPLEADGQYAFNMGACTRQAWFDCSCCPTNLIRFIPFIPNLIYATEGDKVYVNLFMSNKVAISVKGKNVDIQQETDYPWKGDISIRVKTEQPQTFTMKIRIPGWARNEVTSGLLYTYRDQPDESFQISVNGKAVAKQVKNGYVEISREWSGDNRIEVTLPMQMRQVVANPKVIADRGLSAGECGPLVYCTEEIDNQQTVIPYYDWANRGKSTMRVWLKND
ncbi:MAG: Non-reducing end beta-L-arabinofuranosidase [Candidatus Ordinivivax streblomastigis]|uniref:Non-reducing end beta-L-arabinofuranosidase n=1 Tax=Candidatus Ordinivivax streblomastigis TaxID=2540710 RepID=A0A5M8P311_9BACT|nr:MAG: Non-reducing end beta-L-arabinofuranosidase [Candidatus Ordinivivax streblomastigis]